MKHLKNFKLFESGSIGLSKSQTDFLDRYTRGSGYWSFDSQTGLVNVTGDFDCSHQSLKSFKGIRFGTVTRDFLCNSNKLTSLKGAPQKVGGRFNCKYNLLTSLAGAPQDVGNAFYCGNNNLTSLKGTPQEVRGSFWCQYNNLTSLVGAPQKVGRDFNCNSNQLTSLVGAPQEVGGWFDCSRNQLASLEGAPQEVEGYFNCSDNKLTSLEGLAASKIGGTFIKNSRLGISWNLEGWLEGLKKNPRLFRSLIDNPDILEPFLRDDTKLLLKLYPHLSPQTKQELDKRLGISSDTISKLGNLGELGFF
jgi:hypothetical protein